MNYGHIVRRMYAPDNFQQHNFLKINFANIWGLHYNFVECESFLESSAPDILALFETNLDMTQLIQAISLWGVIFFYSKKIL